MNKMKKYILSLLIVIALISSCVQEIPENGGRDDNGEDRTVDDLKFCNEDSDCVLVETIEGLSSIPTMDDECGCDCVTAINKDNLGLWNQKRAEFFGKLECNRQCAECGLTMDNSMVICEFNYCGAMQKN